MAERVPVADKVSLSGNLVAEKLSSGGMVVILVDGSRRMSPFNAFDGVCAVAHKVAKWRRKTWLDKSILGGTSLEGTQIPWMCPTRVESHGIITWGCIWLRDRHPRHREPLCMSVYAKFVSNGRFTTYFVQVQFGLHMRYPSKGK